MKPPNICSPPAQANQPASSEDLTTTNNTVESNEPTKPLTTIASQVQQVPLELTTQNQSQSSSPTSSTVAAATTTTTTSTTATISPPTTTTTIPSSTMVVTTATTTPAATSSNVAITAIATNPAVTTPNSSNPTTVSATTPTTTSSQPLTLVTPIQLQAPIRTSQIHGITPVPITAHQQQLTVLINRPNLPIVPITTTSTGGIGLATTVPSVTSLPLTTSQPISASTIPLTTTTTTGLSASPTPINKPISTGPVTINMPPTLQPTTVAPIPTVQSTTIATKQVVSTTITTTPIVKAEGNKFVCCLLDNGVRCDQVAGNASFSARIQKIVQTKKINYALDSTVRHTYICEHHKTILTAAKKSTTLARDTKANSRNYTANNNALAAAAVVANNYNDIAMRQQQQTLQHPVNLEIMKNQGRMINNHAPGTINSIPIRQGQVPQIAYGHYSGVMPNQVGGSMDVMMANNLDNTGGDTGIQNPSGSSLAGGVDVDLQQLQVNTLRRYKRHFRVQTRPGLNKLQLAESLKSHFKTLPIIEKEAITYFVYIVKCYRNKLDHNPKAE